MDTRRLLFVLGGIGAATVAVIAVLALAGSGGGNDNGDGDSEDGPSIGEDLPDRESGELRLFGPDPLIIDPACAS